MGHTTLVGPNTLWQSTTHRQLSGSRCRDGAASSSCGRATRRGQLRRCSCNGSGRRRRRWQCGTAAAVLGRANVLGSRRPVWGRVPRAAASVVQAPDRREVRTMQLQIIRFARSCWRSHTNTSGVASAQVGGSAARLRLSTLHGPAVNRPQAGRARKGICICRGGEWVHWSRRQPLQGQGQHAPRS